MNKPAHTSARNVSLFYCFINHHVSEVSEVSDVSSGLKCLCVCNVSAVVEKEAFEPRWPTSIRFR